MTGNADLNSVQNKLADEKYHPNEETGKGDDISVYNSDGTDAIAVLDVEKGKVSSGNIDDEIPDKFTGFGLTSVIGCAFFNFNTWGANSAFALYLEHFLQDKTFPGANKYDYAAIGGLAFSSGLIFSPVINYTIGKIGLRRTITIGIFIYFAGIMMASWAVNLWELYLTQGVVAGIGMGIICVANINILPQWFKGGKGGKRNLAMGIQAAGSGIGGIIYNIGMQHVLEHRSFRWSLRAQAIMCFGLNIFSVLMVRTRNHDIKPVYKLYDHQIWTNFGCLCLELWIMFTQLGYMVLMYNLGDFTRSLGYSAQQGSVVSSMVCVGIIYGRPIVGYVGDKIGPVNVTICVSWLVALFSLAMWIPCRNYATAIVFAMFSGSLMGTIWLTQASISAEIVGLRKVGIAMCINWITSSVFGILAPVIGIALKKDGPISPTQYQPASIFVGLCYFMAGVSLVIVRCWLIARNEAGKGKHDDDLLATGVTFGEALSNIFTISRV